VAAESVRRLKGNLKAELRRGRGRNLGRLVQERLTPLLRGWWNYFRLSEVKKPFEELDGWVRRRLRAILWRQWKRPFTRAKNLMKRGLEASRAWRSATNGRGAWWNSRTPHMHEYYPKRTFDFLGLASLLDLSLGRSSRC